MPEIERVLPKYVQIAAHIRDQIVRGDLQPGDEVPSEREIASSWTVARPTAARALEALRLQGLVTSRQGAGTFVRDINAVPRARERYARANTPGGMYSAAESIEFLETALAPAPAHVVEALELPPDSTAIRRSRLLRGKNKRPVELSTSWFRPGLVELAPRLLRPERLVGGTAKYLEEVTGIAPAYGRDQVAARLADSTECELLELAEPAAVLVYRFTVFSSDGRAIQTDDAVHPPDQWAFRQEYPL
jgi:GntR family transcriptional regulator